MATMVGFAPTTSDVTDRYSSLLNYIAIFMKKFFISFSFFVYILYHIFLEKSIFRFFLFAQEINNCRKIQDIHLDFRT